MKIALISGASSGLGVEFIDAVAQKYQSLDEIWIVARRKDRLEKIAEKYSHPIIRPIALDLSSDNAYCELETLLFAEKAEIQVLIANAGVEKFGRFDTMPVEDISSMIDLNVKGTTLLSRVCLPYMAPGSIEVITCSVSSFVPVTAQAVSGSASAMNYSCSPPCLHQNKWAYFRQLSADEIYRVTTQTEKPLCYVSITVPTSLRRTLSSTGGRFTI